MGKGKTLSVTGNALPASGRGFDRCLTWPAVAKAATESARASVSFFIARFLSGVFRAENTSGFSGFLSAQNAEGQAT